MGCVYVRVNFVLVRPFATCTVLVKNAVVSTLSDPLESAVSLLTATVSDWSMDTVVLIDMIAVQHNETE